MLCIVHDSDSDSIEEICHSLEVQHVYRDWEYDASPTWGFHF